MRTNDLAPLGLLAGLLAGCPADPTSLGEPVGSEGSSTSDESSAEGSTDVSSTVGSTTMDEPTGGDDTTTAGAHPPPPGGLGPWGFGYVELPEIEAEWVGFADFGGDGHVDVFARHAEPDQFEYATVTEYFGHGDGTFVVGPSRVIAWGIDQVRTGDFDGDGDIDAAIFDGYHDNAFGLMINNGMGTLATPDSVQIEGYFGSGLATMHDDLDAALDLFVPLGWGEGGAVAVADGAGDFSLGAMVPQPACYFANTVAHDFDGDGLDEIVATGSCNAIPEFLPLAVYRHVGGVLTQVQTIDAQLGPVLEGGELSLIDIDDDGDLDVVTGTELGLYVLENLGDGVLADPPRMLPHTWDGYMQRVIPLLLDGTQQALLLDSPGSIVPQSPGLLVPNDDWSQLATETLDLQGEVAGSADVDGDGLTDVAVLVGENPAVLGLWLSGG